MRLQVAVLAVFFSLAPASGLDAQTPRGDQFLVSATSAGAVPGRFPAAAMDRSGDFVVVWQEFPYQAFGRRYNRGGGPLGVEFPIGPGSRFPRVGMAEDGRFVVLFAKDPSSVPGSAHRMFFQRYDTNGDADGTQTEVSDIAIQLVLHPGDIAVGPSGDFVVVWTTAESPGTDINSLAIVARRYDAAGSPLGDVLQVNSLTTGDQQNPRVAADANGNFVFAWDTSSSQDAGNIWARRWSAQNGEFDGPDFPVNQLTADVQREPSIASDPSGNFAIVWASEVDGGWWGIRGRNFDSGTVPSGDEFRVDQWPFGYFLLQEVPAVGISGYGDVVAVWESNVTLNGDDADGAIEAREIYPDGSATDQFQVNTVTPGDQLAPEIAIQKDGYAVLTWWDLAGIHGRLYRSRGWIFDDGFESGDLSMWQ